MDVESGLKESTDCGKSNDMLAESNSGAASTDVIAYVDGSYRADTGEFSYGMVILQDGQEQCFCQKMTDKELALMHNVAGEIKGSEAAMQYACLLYTSILDENLVRQYVADLGLKYDTMGQTRTFLTYDNRQVEIKGGDYEMCIRDR